MKVKVQPEDFIVREESRVDIGRRPDRFRIFRLRKSQWDTFDLVDLLARRLRVPKADISYGGIKDRFGSTEQLISIRNSPRLTGLSDRNFDLQPIGYSAQRITAESIRGNRFTIVLRDIEERKLDTYRRGGEAARAWGLPNYYDEQRFGSARHGKGWMGREVFLAHREKALRLYFEPSKHDDQKMRKMKKCVIEHWGHWSECLPLAFGEYRRVLEYLKDHKNAYTQALSMIDRKFMVFVLNAYQSYLFNEILSGCLRHLRGLQERPVFRLDSTAHRWGEFLFYDRLPDDLFRRLKDRELPVPGHDSVIDDPEVRRVVEEVLEREGLGLADLRVRQLSGIRVGGAERRMLVLPEDLSIEDIRDDELYPGKKRMTLRLFLPRGAYATLVLKRIEAQERLERQPPASSPTAG